MPTYEYSCAGCGASIERFQRFSDAPLTQCPDCGGQLRRVISAVGVIFKGNGWYCTDSRPREKAETSSTSSESKPAAAATAAA